MHVELLNRSFQASIKFPVADSVENVVSGDVTDRDNTVRQKRWVDTRARHLDQQACNAKITTINAETMSSKKSNVASS